MIDLTLRVGKSGVVHELEEARSRGRRRRAVARDRARRGCAAARASLVRPRSARSSTTRLRSPAPSPCAPRARRRRPGRAAALRTSPARSKSARATVAVGIPSTTVHCDSGSRNVSVTPASARRCGRRRDDDHAAAAARSRGHRAGPSVVPAVATATAPADSTVASTIDRSVSGAPASRYTRGRDLDPATASASRWAIAPRRQPDRRAPASRLNTPCWRAASSGDVLVHGAGTIRTRCDISRRTVDGSTNRRAESARQRGLRAFCGRSSGQKVWVKQRWSRGPRAYSG